jgi:hypothetical protein
MIEADSGTFWVVFIALAIFGFVYNAGIAYLEKHGYDEGYTALLVVVGVVVTLFAAIPVIGSGNIITLGALFAASGGPMIIGSLYRHAKRREREKQANIEEARRG